MFKKFFLLLVCAAYLSAASNITTYIYKTVDDVQIKLDVYTPARPVPAGGYPVFFSLHGGAFIEGNKHQAFTSQELSEIMSRGWVAVTINYRLLPSVVLQEVVEDVQDAYKWIHTELVKFTPINLNLITVFGRSAGGSLAVLSGYKLFPRPQAVVAFYPGCTNWTEPFLYNPSTPVDPLLVASANKLSVPVLTEYTPLRTADPRNALWHTSEHQGKAGWLAVTHDPNLPTDQVMAILRDYSATENVDKNYPPTYLAHGTADTIVPYTQSVQMANSLKQKNVPYVLDLVPGVGHTFDTSANLWQEHVLPAFEFAQKYMQTKTEKTQDMKFLEK